MTQNNKPEWFEILGAGAVVGQTQNETPSAAAKPTKPSIAQPPTGGDEG